MIDLLQYYVCCITSGVMHHLYGALPVPYVPVNVIRCAVIAHRNLRCAEPPAAELRSTAGLLFTCQYLSGTILVTPYSMVWDWRVSRVGPIPFYWPTCSLPFRLLLFSLSFFYSMGWYTWGWGHCTDRVLIALSRPCAANIF